MKKDTITSAVPHLLEPRILEEKEAYFIVDKPAGWVSIPGRDPTTPSVLAWLRERDGATLPVHRIDRGTSGLLLFARTRDFHREASQWFEKHEIRKIYHAICSGRPSVPSFQIRTPIAEGRAITQVQVAERLGEAAFLAEVQIATGKRHQIRIHLSERGHALLGDSEYGGPVRLEDVSIPRVMLHAASLRLPTGVEYQAERPADFAEVLRQLREKGSA